MNKLILYKYHQNLIMSFFRMSESEIQEFINGQQNKNTLQKTVRDVAMATKFLKLKHETRELLHQSITIRQSLKINSVKYLIF